MEQMIRISKTKYNELTRAAKRYDMLRRVFAQEAFEEPAIRKTKTILKEIRASGKYSEAFLASLEEGLKESKTFAHL